MITGSLYIDLSANQKAIHDLVRKGEKQALAEEMVSIYDPQNDTFVFSTEYIQNFVYITPLFASGIELTI